MNLKGQIVMTIMSIISISCASGISGVIMDLSDNPINEPHAKINITLLSGKTGRPYSEIVEVDEDGTFQNSHDLEPGEYLIEPLVPGYQQHSLRVSMKDKIHLKIPLKPIENQKDDLIEPNMGVRIGRGAGSANLTPPKY